VKVRADRNVCICAGMCVLTDDAVFDQDEDGVVVLLCSAVPPDHRARVAQAVQLCPSGALSVSE
jgi:ferredoxin